MAPTDYIVIDNTYSNSIEYITNLCSALDAVELLITEKKHYPRQMNLYKKSQMIHNRKVAIARPREIRSKAI